MQHPRAIVMCQGFEQWVADPLSQLQRLAVPAAGPREVSVGNRQVGNRRQAHQALAIALLRQAAQGFDAIGAGAFAIATAAGDDPTQGQPLRQHRTLCRRRRRWQEATQVTGQLFGGVQLPGQAQGPAVQHNQPWRADQQAIGQVHLPAQQHTDVLLGQQLLFGKVLHQVGGDIQVPCPQGLLHRLVEQPLALEPAAGTQVQARQRQAGLAAAQQVGKQMVIAVPAPMFVQRHQEYLMRLQVRDDLGAVVALTQGIAQLAAEALLARGIVEEALNFGRQNIDHFFEQVIADQALAAMQGLGQRTVGARLAGRQLPETQPGNPAVTALDQIIQGLAAQTGALLAQHRQRLVGGQAQVLFVEFEQLARQTQARQVPVRAQATGDQQHQPRRQVIEEKLQAAIKYRALGQMVVIEHQ
ncbi:hypothetical protein D3C80_1093960 [compost metagenome]